MQLQPLTTAEHRQVVQIRTSLESGPSVANARRFRELLS